LPRGVGGTLGGASTSTTRRGCCAAGARRWIGRHGRRRRGGRATAAGEGERESRLPGFAAGEGEPESPPSGFAAGGDRDREGERKKKNGRDGKETSGSWMPGRDKVWFFSVLPLYFFLNYRWKGRSVHGLGSFDGPFFQV